MSKSPISSFRDKYKSLEKEFCEQVQVDYRDFHLRSRLLRNIMPDGPVDFVLIASEPAGKELHDYLDDWDKAKKRKSRNFVGSFAAPLLHFCIQKYLCRDSETYHLTDLSKGIMPVSEAKRKRSERYERWYPLLKKELNLVGKPGETRIIAIGRTAQKFLTSKNLCGPDDWILHYSGQATPHVRKKIQPWIDGFPDFAKTVSCSNIVKTAKGVCAKAGYSEDDTRSTLKELHEGVGLSTHRKKLMFLYKKTFEELRNRPSLLKAEKATE